MSDQPLGRPSRDDIAEDQATFPHQFGAWLRAMLRGRGDATLRDTIEELIEEQEESEPSLTADERGLLANVLKLRHRTVVDAMVPRADIVAVDIDTGLTELIAIMAVDAHSRLPVYRETLDEVVGIVHVKDVMACIANQRALSLQDIVREVLVVAPSMPVLDLLVQMRQNHQHMALVVDEFGGIDGLVTIEDLVEEIVGEIEDEHDDDDDAPGFVRRPDGSVIVDARLPLEEFEHRVGPVLTEDERDEIHTVGGLVFSLAGRVPGRGEMILHPSGLEFEILDADPRRVKRLRLKNLPSATDSPPSSAP